MQTGATTVKCTLPAQQRANSIAPTVLHAVKRLHSVTVAYARNAETLGARTVNSI